MSPLPEIMCILQTRLEGFYWERNPTVTRIGPPFEKPYLSLLPHRNESSMAAAGNLKSGLPILRAHLAASEPVAAAQLQGSICLASQVTKLTGKDVKDSSRLVSQVTKPTRLVLQGSMGFVLQVSKPTRKQFKTRCREQIQRRSAVLAEKNTRSIFGPWYCKVFSLSPMDIGSLISIGPAESCEFFHDPSSMTSSNEGQGEKLLSLTPLGNDSGYFVNLTVLNNVQKTTNLLKVPITKGEFALLRRAYCDSTGLMLQKTKPTGKQIKGSMGFVLQVSKPTGNQFKIGKRHFSSTSVEYGDSVEYGNPVDLIQKISCATLECNTELDIKLLRNRYETEVRKVLLPHCLIAPGPLHHKETEYLAFQVFLSTGQDPKYITAYDLMIEERSTSSLLNGSIFWIR